MIIVVIFIASLAITRSCSKLAIIEELFELWEHGKRVGLDMGHFEHYLTDSEFDAEEVAVAMKIDILHVKSSRTYGDLGDWKWCKEFVAENYLTLSERREKKEREQRTVLESKGIAIDEGKTASSVSMANLRKGWGKEHEKDVVNKLAVKLMYFDGGCEPRQKMMREKEKFFKEGFSGAQKKMNSLREEIIDDEKIKIPKTDEEKQNISDYLDKKVRVALREKYIKG